MSDANFQIKIGVETQLAQLKAMEAQFERQIVQLRTLGTGGADALKKVESNLSLVRSELVKTASASGAVGSTAGMAFKGVGQAVGQAGYQMQDFAVQVAGGQSALTAFAQQGSQLLGIFGPTGIIAGAVLAVGVLAVKMLNLGDNTEAATSKFKTQKEAIEALIKANRALRDVTDPTGKRQTAAEDVAAANQAYQKQLRLVAEIEAKIQKATTDKSSGAATYGGPGAGASLGTSEKSQQSFIDGLKAKLATARQEAVNLLPALKEAQVAVAEIDKDLQAAKDANADMLRSDAERLDFLKGQQAAAEALGQQGSVEYITRQGKIMALEKQLSDEMLKNVGKLAREQINLQISTETAQRKQIQGAEKLAKAEAEKLATMRADQALADAISDTKRALAELESNRLLDNIEKDAARIPILQAQNAAIEKRIALLRQENATDSNPVSVEQRKAKTEKLADQKGTNDVAIGNSQPGKISDSQISAQNVIKDNGRGDSMGRGITDGLSGSVTQFGTDAQIVAGGIQASFQGAFQGISTSMQGLINGTMTWGDALRNISSTIMNSIIGAISDMFAKWLVGRAAQGLASIAWTQAETTAVIAGETASLPVKTAGAVASGISSYGLAIAGGIAALALIMAASGGFAEGGPVSGAGTGTSDSIPAWLSNGEYVMPAAETAKYRPLLDSMRAGTLNPGQLVSAGPAAGGGSNVAGNTQINIGLMGHMSPQQWAESQSGESHIVDVIARNIHKINGNG